MAVCEETCDSEVGPNWLEKELLIGIKIDERKKCHNFAKTPFYTDACLGHLCVESSLLCCLRPSVRGQETRPQRVTTIPVQRQLSACTICDSCNECKQVALLKHCRVMATTFKRSEAVNDYTIWCHNMLVLYPMVPFVTTEKSTLALCWPTHFADGPIYEPPNVRQRCACTIHCFSKSFMITPRLCDRVKMMRMLCKKKVQCTIEDVTEFLDASTKHWHKVTQSVGVGQPSEQYAQTFFSRP